MHTKKVLFLLFLLITGNSFAQNKAYQHNIVNSKDSSFLMSVIKLFKGRPNPLIDSTSIIISKSINNITIHEGKRINKIYIENKHFSAFGQSDTAFKKNAYNRIANSFNSITNENTIKKNLFFHENEYLNPLVIAYNEKWLRDLSYIQDVRIVTFPLLTDSNSVDLYVITKDVFPFGGSLQLSNINSYDASVTIENIKDKGNSFSIYHNFEINRKHRAGIGASYISRNILGSFIDLSIGANTLERNYSNFENSATSFFIKGNLPLLNPLSKWTGGFEWNISNNNNEFPDKWSDSLYNASIKYNLTHFDTWLGYQLFNKPWNFSNDKYRHFIQFRYLNNEFKSRPENYLTQIDRNYQNITAYLFSYNVFKQKIIRTQYLYGFGRNEDLPSGKSLTITTGQYKRENDHLPYLGVQLESYELSKNEGYIHLLLNGGSSYADNQIVDFKFLASLEKISKLRYLESGYKYRSIFNLSFAEILKNKFNDALLINSMYGIPQLSKERIKGGTRLSANWESIWYNSRPFYGFRQSPFAFANITFMRTIGDPLTRGDIYSTIGGGTRIRNENLIFGTVEIKGFYFPRTNLQLSPWNVSITTNLKFKYNSNLISKPDFVQVN
jgi:hypothetical protein